MQMELEMKAILHVDVLTYSVVQLIRWNGINRDYHVWCSEWLRKRGFRRFSESGPGLLGPPEGRHK